MSHGRPHSVRMQMAAWLTGAVAAMGLGALNTLFTANSAPTFAMRYGNNPKPYNGGVASGAAAHKRAARRRRNIRARSSKRGAA